MPKLSPEIREMLKLGEAVFLEGDEKLTECISRSKEFIHHRSELIIKKRLAVVEFTNGLELILKAILIKNGYCIYKVKSRIFKTSDAVNEIINTQRTVELEAVIRFFKIEYPLLPFSGVDHLRELRNQIVHKGTNIDKKRREYFINAIDCITGVYNKEGISHKKFLKHISYTKGYLTHWDDQIN